MKTERLGLILTPEEKQALGRLADQRYVKMSELVRSLVRDAAGQAGLWPPQNGKAAANGK